VAEYDYRWRKVRRVVLARDEHRCTECGAPATSVDHIVPKDEAPALMYELSNLRAACRAHNEGRVSGRLARMAHINRSVAKVRDW
jgi:5-methylcytosine-specific restriction endonuclease McrA